MIWYLELAVLLTLSCTLKHKAGAFYFPVYGIGVDYFMDAMVKLPEKLQTPVTNSNSSIQYLLYTPANKKTACPIQPSVEVFDKCFFEKSYETKFLIHGLSEIISEDNLFIVLKDALLKNGNYNVITVNWALYNGIPLTPARKYGTTVGEKVAEMLTFIKNHAKVSLKTFHCIGHSLGSHLCGIVGRNVNSLGRITGIDPGGASVVKSSTPNMSLNHTDADFVDVIHTSDIFSNHGLGCLEPIGHLDFYPNGGVHQPYCYGIGNKYKLFKGKTMKVHILPDKILCNHFISIEYFTQSLESDCKFVAVMCQSYSDYEDGKCSSGVKAEMGFHSKKLKGIPPMSKFYLQTLHSPPFCEKVS